MSPRVTIHLIERGQSEKEFVFEGFCHCLIGRADDCQIRLPRDYPHLDISRHHCLLEIDPPVVRVRDLASLNGTFVNGEKIGQRYEDSATEQAAGSGAEAHEVKDGDLIRVGGVLLRVDVEVPVESAMHLHF